MMKKTIVKLLSIFLLVLILFLLGFLVYFYPKLTGHVSKTYEKQVVFYFFDNSTNCSLNGFLFIGDKVIGKTHNGFYNLTYSNYKQNVLNKNQNLSLFGKLGSCFKYPWLYFDKSWENFNIPEENFNGNSRYDFNSVISPSNPHNREFMGFIQPNNVKYYLYDLNFTFNKTHDLSLINFYLNDRINYTSDWDFDNETNHWSTPSETMFNKQGDCEDYSTALLSLFLAYNPALNCYNVIFTGHVTTFCHFNDYYAYYDEGKTELLKQIKKDSKNRKSPLSNFNQEYFKNYNLTNINPYYAYSDNEFYKFQNYDNYLNWQENLSNIKKSSNFFLDYNNEFKKTISELPEPGYSDENPSELRTQTITLASNKVSLPYWIFLLGIGILILLMILLVLINKLFRNKN